MDTTLCTLGSYAKVIMGQSPESEFYTTDSTDTPFLQGNRTFGTKYPTFDTFTSKVTKLANKGSVILSVRAPVGDVNIAPADICLGRGVAAINSVDSDNEFLYYLMRYLAPVLNQNENGSTFGSINKKDLEQLQINLPGLKTRSAIGKLLSDLDKQILINQRVNDNLLTIANQLYDQYFPYVIGDELPDGWKEGKLGDIIEIYDSKRIPLSGKERSERAKLYPYYGAASITDYVDDYLFDGIYLLLGEDGTVVTDSGAPVLQYVFGKFWVNNHAHILTGKNGYSVEALYLLCQRLNIDAIITGAVQPKISQANLKGIEIIIPPETIIIDFSEKLDSLFNIYRNNTMESERLKALRDQLLPKLMSGEIDVSTLEIPN